MSSNTQVEQTLRHILQVINPTRDDWEARFHIIEDVRDAVQTVESLRGATVEPFGSFVSNLFTRWGDLDISIEILTGSHISNTARKQKQSWLADVLRALRRKGTWLKLRFVANARVPILKLEHKLQNISCDISINNLLGQMKSKMLFWINAIDGRFRDMVLLVKEWAGAHDLNESKSGSLNSYCLSLLVIFHFQTCVPAILPPLKELYPGDMAHDLRGVRTDAEKQIEETCAVNINRFRLNRFRQRNPSSLSDLLISFFAKFSDIDVRASEQGINPYSGEWEDVESNMAWLPRTFALYVEDPFEQPANTARSVTSNNLTRLADACRATNYILSSNDHNQAALFATLVGQHRLPTATRSQVRNTNNPGNYNQGRPWVNRSHQSRDTRNNGHSSSANRNRPVQPNQSQAQQQTWRPRPSS
ncbi:hypothetical protein DCAR_0207405 [Daucus carota subsp. sativus]|uniref:Poly(A) RNA polymerase mitochondrial-like central palm domain-containing protein n=1 Tax=Daucus carota subsp. sativus TaxID=79200 RepID=A0AAF1AQ09_DAUCS|nr:PREDICTED: protein HESO1-like [Daucus carota subsp. sativus]WOG88171.1 hypothetical protein DCAR_0207405 [Daucus carota subsp. sativus]